MAGLTIQEIADYNNRNAFTRVRNHTAKTANTFMKGVDLGNQSKLETNNLSESFSLVSGMISRYEMVYDNLSTMLNYAERGASARTESDRDEAIGYLRSLSGGIDDIVAQTKWNDMNTLDGRTIDLSLSENRRGQSRKIDFNSLYTSDELGLDLTDQPSSAKAGVFYDYYSSYRNKDSGVVGLDITEAIPSEVDATRSELETGTYKLEISYAGPDSSISIKSFDGVLINTIEDVDLSGSGDEVVDLGVGVSLSISKEQYMESVDKYDYETNGPAKLFALMDYERVYRHQLRQEDFTQYTEQEIEMSYANKLSDGVGGSIGVDSMILGGIKPGETGFDSGAYTLRVNYDGENSSVEIRDQFGSLKYLDFGVDLSGDEDVKIDTGKGVSFTINKDNFTGDSGRMMALFNYDASSNNNEDFDFNAYARKIQDAIDRMNEDYEVLAEVKDQILQVNSYQNTGASNAGAVSTGAQIAGLIGSSASGVASSIFNAGSANANLAAATNAIFANTVNAMSVQAEVYAARRVV